MAGYRKVKDNRDTQVVRDALAAELERVRRPGEGTYQLAWRADVSPVLMLGYLRGTSSPSLAVAHRLCRLLELDPCAVLAHEGARVVSLCDQALVSDAVTPREAVAEVLRAQLADAQRVANESAEDSPARAVGELLAELLGYLHVQLLDIFE